MSDIYTTCKNQIKKNKYKIEKYKRKIVTTIFIGILLAFYLTVNHLTHTYIDLMEMRDFFTFTLTDFGKKLVCNILSVIVCTLIGKEMYCFYKKAEKPYIIDGRTGRMIPKNGTYKTHFMTKREILTCRDIQISQMPKEDLRKLMKLIN